MAPTPQLDKLLAAKKKVDEELVPTSLNQTSLASMLNDSFITFFCLASRVFKKQRRALQEAASRWNNHGRQEADVLQSQAPNVLTEGQKIKIM